MSPAEISAWLDLARRRVKRDLLIRLNMERAALYAGKDDLTKLVRELEKD